jgi:hypothetical protein
VKLSSLMSTHLSLARREVVTLMVRIADIFIVQNPRWSGETKWRTVGALLSHNVVRASRNNTPSIRTNLRKTAGPIIASIWRKWDIVNDRPLPEGVERVWSEHGGKSEVIWKKTGSSYYTSTSNSSV